MKQKLLACDVDGTLIFDATQRINDQDIEAIKKFRKAGHLFVLCTGRPLVWTLPTIKQNNFPVDGLILCNGSVSYLVDSLEPIKTTEISNDNIPNKIGLEIIKYFYDLQIYSLYWDDGQTTYELNDRAFPKNTSMVQETFSKYISIEETLNLKINFQGIGITPISENIEEAKEGFVSIEKKWGEYIVPYRNNFFVDISPLGVSKGVGIEKFISHLDKDLEIYGVGDSFNDLPMFETVGKQNAFLMAHGELSLEPHVKKIVSSVAECIDIILAE